jgi:hypothetical protein
MLTVTFTIKLVESILPVRDAFLSRSTPSLPLMDGKKALKTDALENGFWESQLPAEIGLRINEHHQQPYPNRPATRTMVR